MQSSFISVLKTFKDMLSSLSEELIKNEWRNYEINIHNKFENEMNKNKKISKSTVSEVKLIQSRYSWMTVKESNKILDKLLPKIYDGQYDILFEIWLMKIKEIKSNEDLVIYQSPKCIEFIAPAIKNQNDDLLGSAIFKKYDMVFLEKSISNIGNNWFKVNAPHTKCQKRTEEDCYSVISIENSEKSIIDWDIINLISDSEKSFDVKQKEATNESLLKEKVDSKDIQKEYAVSQSKGKNQGFISMKESVWNILFQKKGLNENDRNNDREYEKKIQEYREMKLNKKIGEDKTLHVKKIKKNDYKEKKRVKKYSEKKTEKNLIRAINNFVCTVKKDTRWEFTEMIIKSNFKYQCIVFRKIKDLLLKLK